LVGLWVPGEQERARTVVNAELNAPGLEVMRKFDQLARIDCPTLVSVGALDLITPVAAAARSPTRYQTAFERLEVVEGERATSPGRMRPNATGRSSASF